MTVGKLCDMRQAQPVQAVGDNRWMSIDLPSILLEISTEVTEVTSA